jgi:hypothetical protein
MEVFSEVRTLDNQLTVRYGAAVTEFFAVCSRTVAVHGEQCREMAAMLQTVDGGSEWQQALVKGKLDHDWRMLVPPPDALSASIFSQFPASLSREHEIRRAGFIMKQSGGFGKGWVAYYLVLTDADYLHGYRCASLPELDWLRIPSPSLQLHKKGLDDLNQQMLRSIFTHMPGILADPTFSVCIAAPTRVAKEGGMTSVHMSIATPSSGGFFGRSERKLVFKSWLDEDLLEWLGLLSLPLSLPGHAQGPTQADIQEESAQVRQSYGVSADSYDSQMKGEEEYVHARRDSGDTSHQPAPAKKSPALVMENPWLD